MTTNTVCKPKNNLIQNEKVMEWIKKYIKNINPLTLPMDFPKSKDNKQEIEFCNFIIPKEVESIVHSFSHSRNKKPETIFLAVYSLLLYRYSNSKAVSVGALFNNGKNIGIKAVKSYISNTIAANGFINQIEKSLEEFKIVGEIPLNELNNSAIELGLESDSLFETMLIYQDLTIAKVIGNKSLLFDFNIIINKSFDGFCFSLGYNKLLFNIETVEQIGKSYITLLNNFLLNENSLITNIDILSPKEKNTLISDYNNTSVPISTNRSIIDHFEDQVERTPDSIAVFYNDEYLSYKQLNDKANRGANQLLSLNLPPETVIGIYQETTIDTIASIISILKAGYTYLPMDSTTPKDRVLTMLKDSKAKVLLTNIQFEPSIVNLEIIKIQDYFTGNDSKPLSKVTGNSLAYIIYTSGSTGTPKGVMIEHKSVVNLANWLNKEIDFTVNSRMLQMTKICFDVSIDEILCTLLNGASVYIPQSYMRLDKKALTNFINTHKINIVEFVPSLLPDYIIENVALPSINIVITGAERLQPTIKNQVLNMGYTLFNLYGPTETTVTSAFTKCNKKLDIIGKPIDNTEIYIIDKYHNLSPIGVPGELVIGGMGLSRGYLGDENLTNKKFLSCPFKPKTKLYKTGDLARWLPNGNLEFLGRIDNQVKIRGFRVEPGEIESKLLEHKSIKEACVIIKKDNLNNNYLVAFISIKNYISTEQIKCYLSDNLPYYMIPSQIIPLDSIPVTKNGKYDRKSLLIYNKSESNEYNKATNNSLEERLSQLLCSVIDSTKINIEVSFEENGANSIHQIKLIDKINECFNIDISILTLLENTTIKALAKDIEDNYDIKY